MEKIKDRINNRKWNNTDNISSEIFSTLIEETKKDQSESWEVIKRFRPFFELIKNNPDLRKNLSKVLSDWYKKNHNRLYIWGSCAFSLDSPKTNRENFEKILKGDSELWTQDFWDNSFFPIYENILEDSWASFEISKDIKLYIAGIVLKNCLNENVLKEQDELKSKSIIYKALNKNKVADYIKILNWYIPSFEIIEHKHIEKSFKEERLESPDYVKARDGLIIGIQKLFQDALNHNSDEINNIEMAEKIFKFFLDRGVLDTKEGRNIVDGNAIVKDFINKVYDLKDKLAWFGISKIDRKRASSSYYSPYSGHFSPENFTIVASWEKAKISFPIWDIYSQKHGNSQPK